MDETSSHTPVLLTVEQFAEKHKAFTPAALRNMIHRANARHSSKGTIRGNGLLEAGAILRLGRKVLLDEANFFAWVNRTARHAKVA